MGLKVIPGNGAYGDSYPAFYEGNHGDYYLSLSHLSSCHCPSLQYLMPTLGGIL